MTTLAKKSMEWKGDKNNDDMICKLPQPQPSSIGNPKYNFADIPELAVGSGPPLGSPQHSLHFPDVPITCITPGALYVWSYPLTKNMGDKLDKEKGRSTQSLEAWVAQFLICMVIRLDQEHG
ncbi:hypothetical protein M405DRAFT_870375 [Rhizopogon salebrosus TDB-379]|nr:hypothetical protein M405DRAFT_870375 [Rhizopogon salebrosus TDB-379]